MVFAAILDHVVQQPCDRLVFSAAELQHQTCDTEQVVEVGYVASLAQLVPMRHPRIIKCLGYSNGKWIQVISFSLTRSLQPDCPPEMLRR